MQGLDTHPNHWHIVRWTPGVRRTLGTDDTPVPMPLEAIEAIQERVRIRSGPLAGFEAVFDRPMARDGRVRVLLELLGQVGRTEVDELDLEST